MSTLLLALALLLSSILLTALVLWFGARWVKAARPTFARALAAIMLNFVLSVLALLSARWLPAFLNPGNTQLEFVAALCAQALAIVVFWLIIKALVQTTFVRAILVWLVTLIPAACLIAFVFLVVRPFVLEALIIPTN